LVLLAAAASIVAIPNAFAQTKQPKMYRWTDDKGVIHFGDSIPPQYAGHDREVLNSQGVAVGFQQGEVTQAEKNAEKKEQKAAEAAQEVKEEGAKHDRMLLETYLSVQDIEELRDRRLELLDSQIKVTELYLTNLRKRLTELKAEAATYEGSPGGQAARPVPDALAQEIASTTGTIASYETMLEHTRSDQIQLRESFDRDIERFKKLKGS
ncbi:MAG TPA: DUF4124 domain-containing protein, partial [Gammaproteobacteria bacterium]|nr:DUF4124 domain-containing protein [Gammaproteobacteria bacterium]